MMSDGVGIPVGNETPQRARRKSSLGVASLQASAVNDPKMKAFIASLDADTDGRLGKAEVVRAATLLVEERESHARTKCLAVAALVALCAVVFGLALGAAGVSKEVRVDSETGTLSDRSGNEVAARTARHVADLFGETDTDVENHDLRSPDEVSLCGQLPSTGG